MSRSRHSRFANRNSKSPFLRLPSELKSFVLHHAASISCSCLVSLALSCRAYYQVYKADISNSNCTLLCTAFEAECGPFWKIAAVTVRLPVRIQYGDSVWKRHVKEWFVMEPGEFGESDTSETVESESESEEEEQENEGEEDNSPYIDTIRVADTRSWAMLKGYTPLFDDDGEFVRPSASLLNKLKVHVETIQDSVTLHRLAVRIASLLHRLYTEGDKNDVNTPLGKYFFEDFYGVRAFPPCTFGLESFISAIYASWLARSGLTNTASFNYIKPDLGWLRDVLPYRELSHEHQETFERSVQHFTHWAITERWDDLPRSLVFPPAFFTRLATRARRKYARAAGTAYSNMTEILQRKEGAKLLIQTIQDRTWPQSMFEEQLRRVLNEGGHRRKTPALEKKVFKKGFWGVASGGPGGASKQSREERNQREEEEEKLGEALIRLNTSTRVKTERYPLPAAYYYWHF